MDNHNIDGQLNTVSIGFWGNAKFKQKGDITQAPKLFIHTLFSKWNFVVLNANVENLLVRKLCEKDGFLLKVLNINL
ncbi:hypothetical protein F938_00667 [Acinetobacter bereziniae LMG 1003 = CIP 70.12]|jgi:hypothetical protein|uniref:Uncharacterized protein n=2 Tax=Acinetobacter bereziniae TaxID=106648 RepID=N9EYG6_ACIBZ|nr:hypothetical protein [Acinetobacter bereziniae]ENV21418.1 hypothetical protein F963_02559 [Acinetobacter bereziniae NIPH 3]ENW00025.1 hypothetical protein F938_00667 [Acinetobacter bereziniae LMG 1003 = CIP 70.12]MBJ9908442.1 hypothetical protein [Acinetobacter bereziniae]MBJ9929678.1 hypothetical protein [Acinetobacter bereziniae]MCU4315646.1 hypothetical protein [Acinetobacter bereziniae]